MSRFSAVCGIVFAAAIGAGESASAQSSAESRAATRDHAVATSRAHRTERESSDREIAAAVRRETVRLVREASPAVVTVRAFMKAAKLPPTPAADAEQAENSGWGDAAFNDDYAGYRLVGAGSGFFVDEAGDVLTCMHFLQRPDGSFVDLIDVETSDRARFVCDLVGAEPTVNLAVLRTAFSLAGSDGSRPPALRFGDSDRLEPGDRLLALGDPSGPEKFVATADFVAKPSRDCYQELLSAFYMQAAFVAPPQAYGGPLLDFDGTVVGIVAPRAPKPGSPATDPRFGLELALPSKIVVGLYDALKTARSTRSPWLGFAVMSREELALQRGLAEFERLDKPRQGILIESVFRPSPAAEAGIEPGDFLVGFDAYRVFAPVDFQRYLYLAGVGSKVTLEIYRRGETLKKTLEIKVRPPEAQPK
jgi:serine protease Do